jgi:hypothetical protein
MKYLKIFEDFTPDTGLDTSWADNDGNKITITDVIEYLDEKGIPVEELETKLLKDIIIDTKRDLKRVDSADLDFPIIVSKKNGEFSMVLDGQHRVAKCLKNGIKTINARVLDLDNAPENFKKMFK